MLEALKHLLFIDIETASGQHRFEELSEGLQQEWLRKAQFKWNVPEGDAAALFVDKAAILAEFGKIVCISIGCLRPAGNELKLLMRSFALEDERILLEAFCSKLEAFSHSLNKEHAKSLAFVGHNIKEFDLPYISRRLIIQGLPLPECLKLHGKKPWEVPHLDTMQLWGFGDVKAYTRLALLAEVLGIPSPKDDINGADVSRVYWQDRNLPRIATYCQKDVETTVKVYLRLMGHPEINFRTEILSD
ncbi:MAG: ribonuclease H-like domain-containing protein [Bacteroidetes bacterium]|nr:ribonuclease H-like domain-containing protein [Bacteroidota bacterium]